VDLCSGTGTVALAAADSGYEIICNDLQPYSAAILKSMFVEPTACIDDLLQSLNGLDGDKHLLGKGRQFLAESLAEESSYFEKFEGNDWPWEKYAKFCNETEISRGDEVDDGKYDLFSKYYSNTYFGVRQCLEIDFLREYADSCTSPAKAHVLAATISAMTYAVSSTTHLAQYLKPKDKVSVQRLYKRRKISIIEMVFHGLKELSTMQNRPIAESVHQMDYLDALDIVNLGPDDIVYVDPPYFKEHYSRYYHVLDTFYLYDYPELTFNPRIDDVTVGRYRKDRLSSDFGKKAKVKGAFNNIFEQISQSGSTLALSYAQTSLVSQDELISMAASSGLRLVAQEGFVIMHSGQGQPRNQKVEDYLLLFRRS
tara:strand:+ start:628 stop:1734 length:1107 start_codon:yes stop_codon:yes gene_type:complete